MEEKPKKNKKINIRQILLGNILLNDQVLKWMPAIALITFFGILMIASRFRGEKILRQMVEVQERVKELRSESATVEAELMNLSRYSTILNEVEKKGLGLKTSDEPPVKIIVRD
jgi:hypothetical protein